MSTRERFATLAGRLARDEPRPTRVAKAYRVDDATADTDTATVWIYDEIGGWGIWADELVPELAALTVSTIVVRLNSPGGDYFDGVAIGNALALHPAKVVIQVDGLAASAASIIAMAGDEIVMRPCAQMMIHDALTRTHGNAADHEKTRNLLDQVSEDIAALYASRTGRGDVGTWRTSMRAETWYRGEEAVTAGLATSSVVREPSDATNATWRDVLAAYRHAPSPQGPSSSYSPAQSLPATHDSEHLVSALRKAFSPCPLP